jgi:hypothetical protein
MRIACVQLRTLALGEVAEYRSTLIQAVGSTS